MRRRRGDRRVRAGGRVDDGMGAADDLELQALGARPFIFPAMGSHGGATPAGQIGVLAEYGVTDAIAPNAPGVLSQFTANPDADNVASPLVPSRSAYTTSVDAKSPVDPFETTWTPVVRTTTVKSSVAGSSV